MSLSLFTLTLLNSISAPNFHPVPHVPSNYLECKDLDKYQCVTTYYCGWCDNNTIWGDDDDIINYNNTNTSSCIDIGYCGIGTLSPFCPNLRMSTSCFLVKTCLLAFVLIVCINLVYCVIKGIQPPLLKSNFSPLCKKFTISVLYMSIFIPLIMFYFINFTVFVFMITSSALLGILFWCCYGGTAVIRIVNVDNNDIQSTRDPERTRLINN